MVRYVLIVASAVILLALGAMTAAAGNRHANSAGGAKAGAITTLTTGAMLEVKAQDAAEQAQEAALDAAKAQAAAAAAQARAQAQTAQAQANEQTGPDTDDEQEIESEGESGD
ncbi:MAG TPA: hypothetical protein VN913_07390 [Candidatus Binatus sp.]|jgi:hypothetical protein|nr:hypothetical protein [Candidatus Binatus sp.]